MSALKKIDTGKAKVKDEDLIGNSYGLLDTAIYPFIIKEAYVKTANSGAIGIHLLFTEKKDGTGQQFEKDVYITSGDEKGNKSYWTDKQGEDHALPGFLLIDSLVKLVINPTKEISDIPTTKTATQIYDYDEKERVTIQVDMLKPLLNKPVYVAIQRQLVDKRQRNESTGKYVTVPGFREENDIMKFFRAKDKKTVTEVEANNADPASFFHTWNKKFAGNTRDRRSKDNRTAAPEGVVEDNSDVSGVFS